MNQRNALILTWLLFVALRSAWAQEAIDLSRPFPRDAIEPLAAETENVPPQPIVRFPPVEPDKVSTPASVVGPTPVVPEDYPIDGCDVCGQQCQGGLCRCQPTRSPFWCRSELMLAWMEGYATPPLLTSSPAGTPTNSAGILGLPSTTVLYGGETLGAEMRVGGRLTGGWWFNDARRLGIQGELFGLGSASRGANFPEPTDGTILARPFFNNDPAVNGPDSQILHQSGNAIGSVDFDMSSDVYSAAPAFRRNLLCSQDCCGQGGTFRVDGLMGYRYLQLNERFRALEVLEPQGAMWPMNSRFELADSMNTKNEFHGFELGAVWMRQKKRLIWEVTGLLAFGSVRRQVELDGSTRYVVEGVSDTTVPGGFLVGPEEVGRRVDRDFAVVPQVRCDAGYLLRDNWRVSIGYNFLFLSSLSRPGAYMRDSFDGSTLGLAPPAGSSQPTDRSSESVWLHGLTFGLTYQF